jgi:hypothetical protein
LVNHRRSGWVGCCLLGRWRTCIYPACWSRHLFGQPFGFRSHVSQALGYVGREKLPWWICLNSKRATKTYTRALVT